MNQPSEGDVTTENTEANGEDASFVIHVLRDMSEFPDWTDPDRFASFMYESLKPYEDPLPQVRQGVSDALEPQYGEKGFVLIGEISQEIVGGLIMLRTGMKGYIPENLLLMVAVDPSTRGMGLGAKIIKKAFELADGDVKLHVEYDNPAKRLYERLGMTSKYAEMRYCK